MKYVYVTYDPLLEKVLCVHLTSNGKCRKCNRKEYRERNTYQLERNRFGIKDIEYYGSKVH